MERSIGRSNWAIRFINHVKRSTNKDTGPCGNCFSHKETFFPLSYLALSMREKAYEIRALMDGVDRTMTKKERERKTILMKASENNDE